MTRLFRGDRANRVKDTTQSFLPPSRRGRTKEIDVFRSFPSTHFLLTSAVRPERYERGRVYARTSNQSGTGYRRLYMSWHRAESRRYVPKSGRRFASSPSWISPIRGLLPRRRLPDNNGAFHMPPATKVFAAGPSQVRFKYVLDARLFGSPFRHRSLRARRNELNLIEYRYRFLLIPCQSTRRFDINNGNKETDCPLHNVP